MKAKRVFCHILTKKTTFRRRNLFCIINLKFVFVLVRRMVKGSFLSARCNEKIIYGSVTIWIFGRKCGISNWMNATVVVYQAVVRNSTQRNAVLVIKWTPLLSFTKLWYIIQHNDRFSKKYSSNGSRFKQLQLRNVFHVPRSTLHSYLLIEAKGSNTRSSAETSVGNRMMPLQLNTCRCCLNSRYHTRKFSVHSFRQAA
jgi:hypothetical protein